EPGLAEGVAGAFAVRDVQERVTVRLAALAREIRSAAGAAVEGIAGAADDPGEIVAHAPQARDPRVDLVDLRGSANAELLRRRDPAAPRDADVFLDLGEREAQLLRLLHRAHEADGLL